MNSNADNTNYVIITVVFNLFLCSVPANTAIDLAVASVARCSHSLAKQHNLVIVFFQVVITPKHNRHEGVGWGRCQNRPNG